MTASARALKSDLTNIYLQHALKLELKTMVSLIQFKWFCVGYHI